MKTLPTKLEYDGFNLTQIAREGLIAVYEQRKPGVNHVGYETIRIQTHKAATIPNGDGTFRDVEEGESYPKSHRWGVDGFTSTTREAAMQKFCEMVKEDTAKTPRS